MQSVDTQRRFYITAAQLRQMVNMKLQVSGCISKDCKNYRNNLQDALISVANVFDDLYKAYVVHDQKLEELINSMNKFSENFGLLQRFSLPLSLKESNAKLAKMGKMIRMLLERHPKKSPLSLESKRTCNNSLSVNGSSNKLASPSNTLNDSLNLARHNTCTTKRADVNYNGIHKPLLRNITPCNKRKLFTTPKNTNLNGTPASRILSSGERRSHFSQNKENSKFLQGEPLRSKQDVGVQIPSPSLSTATATVVSTPMSLLNEKKLGIFRNEASTSWTSETSNLKRSLTTLKSSTKNDEKNMVVIVSSDDEDEHAAGKLNKANVLGFVHCPMSSSSTMATEETSRTPMSTLLMATTIAANKLNRSSDGNDHSSDVLTKAAVTSAPSGFASSSSFSIFSAPPPSELKKYLTETSLNLSANNNKSDNNNEDDVRPIMNGNNNEILSPPKKQRSLALSDRSIKLDEYTSSSGRRYFSNQFISSNCLSHPLPFPSVATAAESSNVSRCDVVTPKIKRVIANLNYHATENSYLSIVRFQVEYEVLDPKQVFYLYYYLKNMDSVWKIGKKFSCKSDGRSIMTMQFEKPEVNEILWASFRVGFSDMSTISEFSTPIAIHLNRSDNGSIFNIQFDREPLANVTTNRATLSDFSETRTTTNILRNSAEGNSNTNVVEIIDLD